jgi:hypothetical protein
MRRYTARMEFFAVAEEVEKLLDQGASYVLAYEKLQNEKKSQCHIILFIPTRERGQTLSNESINPYPPQHKTNPLNRKPDQTKGQFSQDSNAINQ